MTNALNYPLIISPFQLSNWESMDSEAVSRPDRKEKSIGSGSVFVPVVDQQSDVYHEIINS